MKTQMIKKTFNFLLFTLLLAFLPINSFAASTDWQSLDGGRIRLLASALKGGSEKEIAITFEIELNEGWKTYWKNPGSSGVPPNFNWEKSKNLQTLPNMAFPTPQLIEQVDGKIIGYKKHVSFITKIRPKDLEKPVLLNLTALLGICSDICVPIKVEFQLDTTIDDIDQMALDAHQNAQKLLPSKTNERIEILKIAKMEPNNLKISAKIPSEAKALALLPLGAEGWYLFPAKLIKRDGDRAEFNLDIFDIPENGDALKTPIEYTLIADGTAIATTKLADE